MQRTCIRLYSPAASRRREAWTLVQSIFSFSKEDVDRFLNETKSVPGLRSDHVFSSAVEEVENYLAGNTCNQGTTPLAQSEGLDPNFLRQMATFCQGLSLQCVSTALTDLHYIQMVAPPLGAPNHDTYWNQIFFPARLEWMVVRILHEMIEQAIDQGMKRFLERGDLESPLKKLEKGLKEEVRESKNLLLEGQERLSMEVNHCKTLLLALKQHQDDELTALSTKLGNIQKIIEHFETHRQREYWIAAAWNLIFLCLTAWLVVALGSIETPTNRDIIVQLSEIKDALKTAGSNGGKISDSMVEITHDDRGATLATRQPDSAPAAALDHPVIATESHPASEPPSSKTDISNLPWLLFPFGVAKIIQFCHGY